MRYIFRVPWEDYSNRYTRYAVGDAAPEKHPKWEWLVRHNIIVDANTHPHAEEAAPVATPPEENPVEEPRASAGKMKRPYKAAKLAVWQEYARAQGLDPKGMTREEIIARFI